MSVDISTPGSADSPRYVVASTGESCGYVTLEQLRVLAASNRLRPTTRIRDSDSDMWVEAQELPWLFSDRRWLVALMLSATLGTFGVDRFYLGHHKLGLAKLATIGGLGLWALLDVALIAVRVVRDADGLPLR